MESFGLRLKKLRGRLVSQQQLAVKSGLTLATISKLERGEHQPSRGTIVKLAEALKVPPEVLWGGDVADASETVYVPLPRPVYESIARRAAFEKWPDVVSFLKSVATEKTFVIEQRDPPGDGINSPRPAAAAPHATRASRRSAPARR